MLKKILPAAIMAAFSIGIFPAAHAQLFGGDNEARRAILDLRTKVETKAESSALLALQSQNEELRQQINQLNGQIEVLQNELSNAQTQQKTFYMDLDNRLKKLEPQQVEVDGQDALVQQSEQRHYDAALEQFRSGDYKGAHAAFQTFLQHYPKSAYAPAARYWIGNALYAQRDYHAAIAAQNELVEKHPESPKAADGMLNIASSYNQLKNRAEAQKTLELLIETYPDSPSAETARERLESLDASK